MPWLRDLDRSRNIRGRGPDNMPPGRLDAAIAEGERIAAQPARNRQRQLKEALDVMHRATRDSLNALIDAHRLGYELPTTKLLLSEHAKALPKSAREELRAFIDEARPAIESGDFGRPREAGRRFTWEIAEGLVNDGWRPPQPEIESESESPAALAALVPRG